jgi:hypothetical protein
MSFRRGKNPPLFAARMRGAFRSQCFSDTSNIFSAPAAAATETHKSANRES